MLYASHEEIVLAINTTTVQSLWSVDGDEVEKVDEYCYLDIYIYQRMVVPGQYRREKQNPESTPGIWHAQPHLEVLSNFPKAQAKNLQDQLLYGSDT